MRKSQHDELRSEGRRGPRPVAGWHSRFVTERAMTLEMGSSRFALLRTGARQAASRRSFRRVDFLVSADEWHNDDAASSLLAAYVFFSSRFQYGRNQPACPIGAEMSCP